VTGTTGMNVFFGVVWLVLIAGGIALAFWHDDR
jgi:hypothetical protein